VDTVAGYTTYIDLIRPFIKDKNIISTQMTKEVKRVRAAIDVALTGRSCAIVSSGDPGIYAMAGLVFEICKKENIQVIPPFTRKMALNEKSTLTVEVVPGIPALCAGASLLGAPLSHDFAAISLSDLLTSWEIIEKRIEAAASADFVIVLYNPKSKRRSRQLETAQKIILKYRDKKTPAGIVVSAMRKDEMVTVIPLEDLHKAHVNMQTIIFIGNSTSFTYLDFMVTPRGYRDKI
jgi:precorrin-3B C17-methyltransferase